MLLWIRAEVEWGHLRVVVEDGNEEVVELCHGGVVGWSGDVVCFPEVLFGNVEVLFDIGSGEGEWCWSGIFFGEVATYFLEISSYLEVFLVKLFGLGFVCVVKPCD